MSNLIYKCLSVIIYGSYIKQPSFCPTLYTVLKHRLLHQLLCSCWSEGIHARHCFVTCTLPKSICSLRTARTCSVLWLTNVAESRWCTLVIASFFCCCLFLFWCVLYIFIIFFTHSVCCCQTVFLSRQCDPFPMVYGEIMMSSMNLLILCTMKMIEMLISQAPENGCLVTTLNMLEHPRQGFHY